MANEKLKIANQTDSIRCSTKQRSKIEKNAQQNVKSKRINSFKTDRKRREREESKKKTSKKKLQMEKQKETRNYNETRNAKANALTLARAETTVLA